MRVFSSTSIRAKLIAIVMVVTCTALVLAGMALAAFEFVSHRRAVTQELATIADIIGANSTAALAFNDPRAAEEILAALAPQPDILDACLYDEGGHLFARYLRTARAACPQAPEPDGEEFRGRILVRSGPVLLAGRRVGTLHLVATLGLLQQRLELFGLVLLVVITASALAALLFSARLQRQVSLPILELARIATRISGQRDYALRAPQGGQDEIGVAVAAFNHMLDRIQDADRALREASEKSREQAQIMGSVLDNMGEGLVACDLAGKTLLLNPAAARLLGQGAAAVEPAEWPRQYGLYRDEGKIPFDAGDLPLARALRGEEVTDEEVFVRPPSLPHGRWISVTARPLRDALGELRGGIAVFRDVSERKQAEAELRASEARLRQAQKMEAIGQLAGGIAHDFNNLLTVICGYSIFALERLPEGDPVRGDIEEVKKAGERASALTRQLLAFSRKQVLAPRLLDLNAVVAGLDTMLRRLIGEDIELVCACAQDPGMVRADPSQVEQIILNLAVNARDAMPQGGRLTIETAIAEIDGQYARQHLGARAGSYALLTVTDSGVGMDAQTQAHIFEPFFTTKEQGKGTGLGLSTVYGIVQQSGGHVAVTSEVGRGTSFRIYLPRTDEPAAAKARPTESTPVPRGKETILLAEDEEPVRNLVAEVLTGLGYTVLATTNGLEALRARENHQGAIHLLVTDVVMPRMSGPELAKRLVPLVPRMGILFLSGYAADPVVHQGIPGAETAFLQKPFTPEALARKVREILDAAARAAEARTST